ncbi:MAG: hypothetical protein JRF59_09125 [Deltaproteobacteria bacterium]|nr:hypothetical protein [Deltaproteobacteria bacterium]
MLDRDPVAISYGENQGVLWIRNQADAMIGDATFGDSLLYRPKTDTGFDPPQTLWAGQKGILKVAFVEGDAGEAHVVFAVDEDGNLDTAEDRELYGISTLNGVWQAASRLTDDSVEDGLPCLLAPNGTAMCVWKKEDRLMYTTLSDWNPQEVFAEQTDKNEPQTLVAQTMPGGAAIAYSVQGPRGMDIFAAFYDRALDRWSLPRQMTFDEHAESALSLAFDGADLVIAYVKTLIERTTKEVEINGETCQIDNVPQPGRADLYLLRHSLGYDPALVPGSLSCLPVNPAPGDTATLKATVENRGDLACDIHVVFYDGDPGQGGTSIGEETIAADVLVPGGKREVSVLWRVPSVEVAQNIFVVVDPEGEIEDRDRSNNVVSIRTLLPDLVIDGLSESVILGTTVLLTAKVHNAGVVATGGTEVAWRLDSENGPEIGRCGVAPILPGATREVAFQWNVGSSYAPGQVVNIYAVLDPGQIIEEFDEKNNVGEKAVQVPFLVPSCRFDMEKDGDTDGEDLAQLIKGLGTHYGGTDIQFFAAEFGREDCPVSNP